MILKSKVSIFTLDENHRWTILSQHNIKDSIHGKITVHVSWTDISITLLPLNIILNVYICILYCESLGLCCAAFWMIFNKNDFGSTFVFLFNEDWMENHFTYISYWQGRSPSIIKSSAENGRKELQKSIIIHQPTYIGFTTCVTDLDICISLGVQ